MKNIRTSLAVLTLAGLAAALPPAVLAKDSEALQIARQLNEAFIEVADNVSPSVVVITVTEKKDTETMQQMHRFFQALPPELQEGEAPQRTGQGSGVIVREDGYIVTNNHVVNGAEKIRVRLKDGREFDAEVRGTYPDADIAVVKLKGDVKNLHVAKFADSEKVRVGEFAIAIGAPFELDYSVTYGHVSAKGRANLGGGPGDQDFIQTDASINPGNSGGPLVNLNGEIIGINSMIRGMGTGIGFAIPANNAHEISDRLIADGKFTRSWLGILMGSAEEYRQMHDSDEDQQPGVLVRSIPPGGPASKSKLEPGDIIKAVDGKPVTAGSQLRAEIARKVPGKEVVLDVQRDKKSLQVTVKPEAMPDEKMLNANFRRGTQPEWNTPGNGFGATVKALTEDLAKEYDLKGVSRGVIVTDVEENSPAAKAGLQPGDVITDINGQAVATPKEFRSAFKSGKGDGARIKLLRDGAKTFLFYKDHSD
jgi:serine protease Do